MLDGRRAENTGWYMHPDLAMAGVAVTVFILLASVLGAQESADPEVRLKAMGLTLPTANAPVANYVRAVRTGDLLYLSAHGECGTFMTGKAGRDVSTDSAYASARRTALCLLATIKAELGDLRRVHRVVQVTGLVNATPEFTEHPRVINGCSDLLVAVFGDRGRHVRSASGAVSLPLGRTVSIEMIVEVARE